MANEVVTVLILFGIPLSLWIHQLFAGGSFVLVVVTFAILSQGLDLRYSTVDKNKKLYGEKIFETMMTYLFIFEVEFGFVLFIESIFS